MKKSILLISLILSVITAQPGNFSVPNVISFQGMLTNVDGSVYQDGDYGLTFRFIRTMQDGSEQAIWEEVHTASVSSGVFSVILGSNTPLPQYISGNAMLETQVGDEILSPRQPFTSVPFSLRANGAQFSEQALRSDSSNFAQTSHHSIYADTSAFALNAPTAINATHATFSDTSMFTYQSMNSVYSDTALYVGESIYAEFSDSSLSSFSAIHADTAHFAVGYTATSSLSAVALSNDYNDLTNLPDADIGISTKYIELTLDLSVTPDGIGNFDFSNILELSEHEWIEIRPIRITSWDNISEDFSLYFYGFENTEGGNGINQGSFNILLDNEFPVKPVVKMQFPNYLYIENTSNQLLTSYYLSGRDIQINVLCEVIAD